MLPSLALDGPDIDNDSNSDSSDIISGADEAAAGLPVLDAIAFDTDAANLDVSTLITLVSELTNGDAFSFHTRDKMIAAMLVEEQTRRMLPDLLAFLLGKRLVLSSILQFSLSIIPGGVHAGAD